jgi:hypothetical protein
MECMMEQGTTGQGGMMGQGGNGPAAFSGIAKLTFAIGENYHSRHWEGASHLM